MNKIQIANILLTRRCNLRCEYCSIVSNYNNMPKEYPSLNTYQDMEYLRWIRILDLLKKNNPNIFIIFYGGEPMLYADLDKIIQYCHQQNIAYTIISNNTPAVHFKIIELYNSVGKIQGFSASIDPVLAKYKNLFESKDLPHYMLKTKEGFSNLIKLKNSGMIEDVVAEITATSENIQYLYDTVKILSNEGIYSDITVIDLKKNNYYDFSTIEDLNLQIYQTKEVKDEFVKIINDDTLKVHIPDILYEIYDILPSNLKCDIYNDVHNVTIDSNGSFRLCLRIRGVYTPGLKLDNVFLDNGNINTFFISTLKKDYENYCQGCNWPCMLMSKKFSNKVKDH